MANIESMTGGLQRALKEYRHDNNEANLVNRLRYLTERRDLDSRTRPVAMAIAAALSRYLFEGRKERLLLDELDSIVEYERQYRQTWEYEPA